jgi:hypothetical protein
MWSYMVVVFSPRFDLRSGVVKVQEPTLVEACDTNTGIEVLDENVIGGFTSAAKAQERSFIVGELLFFNYLFCRYYRTILIAC